MTCEKCGTENNADSKFCRNCGRPLHSKVEFHFSIPRHFWKTKAFLIGGLIILLLIVGFGSKRAYAFYHVEHDLGQAKQLQSQESYDASNQQVEAALAHSTTAGERNRADALKKDNVRFAGYQTSYQASVKAEMASSSDALLDAQTSLQGIPTDYPGYKNVQTELTKIQNALVANLRSSADKNGKDADAAKKLASINLQAATAAKAGQAAAQRAAQQAQAQASQVQANAEATREAEVEKSYYNQLATIYSSYIDSCTGDATTAVDDYNDGDYTSENLYLGSAVSACASVEAIDSDLNTTFTGMPNSYTTAGTAMSNAGYYMGLSLRAFVNQDYDSAQTYATDAGEYEDQVTSFFNS